MRSLENPENYVILPASATNPRDLFVSMVRTNHSLTWYCAHKTVNRKGAFMPTPRQFIDFLELLKSGQPVYDGRGTLVERSRIESVLNDVSTKRGRWRAEWLDTYFIKTNGVWTINYEHRTRGDFVQSTRSEPLEACLMEDCYVNLSIVNRQGLPATKSINEDVYFCSPNNSGTVIGFGVFSNGGFINCNWNPHDASVGLGVRKFFEG